MRGCYFFLGDIAFNLCMVGVIVGQRGMNLGEGQMRILEGNFRWGHAHLGPADDSPDCYSGAGDLRASATDCRVPINQGVIRLYSLISSSLSRRAGGTMSASPCAALVLQP